MCAAALRRAAARPRLLLSPLSSSSSSPSATRPPPRSVRAVVSRQCCRVFVCAVFWPTLASNNSIINNNYNTLCTIPLNTTLPTVCSHRHATKHQRTLSLHTFFPPLVPPPEILTTVFARAAPPSSTPHICSSLCSLSLAPPPLFPPIGPPPPVCGRRRRRRHPAASVGVGHPLPRAHHNLSLGSPAETRQQGTLCWPAARRCARPCQPPGPALSCRRPLLYYIHTIPTTEICPACHLSRALVAASVPATIQYQGYTRQRTCVSLANNMV